MKEDDTTESAATISKDAVLNKEVVAEDTEQKSNDKTAMWVLQVSKLFTLMFKTFSKVYSMFHNFSKNIFLKFAGNDTCMNF